MMMNNPKPMTCQERDDFICREMELKKEIVFYQKSFERIANALGIECEFQLYKYVKNNEQTYVDLLLEHIHAVLPVKEKS